MKKSTLIPAKSLVAALFILVFSNQFFSQNVVVAGAATNGTYATLGAAFTAINGGVQTGNNISVTIIGNTAEGTTAAALNEGAWATLSITPSGGAARVVNGAVAAALVNLNGADRVYIDGLNTGGNSLTFSNTSVATTAGISTIRLINGATNNTITNCVVQGGNANATAAGNILFSTTTATVGNSFNLVSNCTITAISGNNPAIGVLSAGSTGTVNTDNAIQNCVISDYFKATIANYGIFVSSNNTRWTITGNKFFQSTGRVFTTAAVHKVIAVSSGDANLVANNLIGYSSVSATGTYSMSGAVASRFVGIEMSAGTLTASAITANTISAVTLTTTGTTASANGMLCGINVLTGHVNVSGNLIGATSGISSFNLNPTGTAGWLVGINSSSTGSINIAGNFIGALTSTNTALATTAGQIMCINLAGAAAMLSITNNTVGNATAENIQAGTATLTTASSVLSGINMVTGQINNPVISGNVFQNFSSYGTGTGGYVRGIWGTTNATTASFLISNNTITNLTSNNSNATISNALIGTGGIVIASCRTATISNNAISGVVNTGTSTGLSIVSGIACANPANATASNVVISSNRISNINNNSPGTTISTPPVAAGITLRSGNATVVIQNNMISLGGGPTSSNMFVGIFGNHGSNPNPNVQIYHNTINIEGSAAGAMPSFGYHRGDFSVTQRTASVDIKNNLITNSRTGGTGEHCAISNNYGTLATSTGWPANVSDYNVLNANPATIGWWGAAMNMAGWQFASGGDQNSYSGINVTYVNSANDLHLNMGTIPTAIESGGTLISAVANDIDQQQRPGPFNSINGGALQPDIGADEIDGVEGGAPVVNYIPLGTICSNGNRTLTATVKDISGIPTAGVAIPRIYFKKNAGSYFSSPGVFVSGTATNSTWSFTVNAATLGGLASGDNVSYYIVAQDLSFSQNVGSNPSAGLSATSVNSIITAPTAPSVYSISATSLAGTYTVGSSGTYTTLTTAADAYNNSCLTNSVTFVLTDPSYAANETFPIVFLNNTTASATNSLLVRPASGTAVAIAPSNPSISSVIKFLNARYITFDGINTSGSSLSVSNSNTTSTSANIWLASTYLAGPGCSNIGIKNLALTGGTVSASDGIVACVDYLSPNTTGGPDNDNITISGNTFLNFNNGVVAIGTGSISNGGIDNWMISGNVIGPAVTSTNVVIAGNGIALAGAVNCSVMSNIVQNINTAGVGVYGVNINDNVNGFTVSQNTLTNFFSIGNTNGVTAISGIYTGVGSINGVISTNSINNISSTTIDGYGSRGIIINSGLPLSNINIKNNFVSNINSVSDDDNTFATYWPVGIDVEGASTGGINIDYNSVNLYGVWPGYEGAQDTAASAALVISSTGGNINIRNNILCNTYGCSFTTTTKQDVCYAIYCLAQPNGNFPLIDNNCYYVGGVGTTTHTPILAFLGGTITTLYGLQTAFGQNLNSINFQPQFTTPDDLHLLTNSVNNAAINNYGQVLAGITTDFDGQTRSASNPDIGADEFTATATCTSAVGGTISPASYTLCTPQNLVLTSPNISSGLGTSYAWKIGSAAGGPYTAAPSGTGVANPTYAWNGLPAGTYYMVLQTNCASPALNGSSNEVTVTINTGISTSITASSAFVCPGNSATLTASGATSYLWNNAATTTSIVVTPTANTVYSFTGTTAPCATSSSIAILYSNPVITISPLSPTICSGLSTVLTASGANSYTWSTATISNSIVTPPAAAPASYTVTGTDANGCVSTPYVRLVDITTQQPTISITGNLAVCPGQPANLSAFGATSYTWDTGAQTSTVSVNPLTSTTYTVIGRNAYGCSSSTTQLVSVGSLSVSVTGPSTVCYGQAANLSANGAITYTWSDGSQTSTIAPTPTINTTYTVVGTAGSCSNSAVKSVTVNPTPTVSISGAQSTVCAGQTVTLTANGANTYSWSTTSSATVITPAPIVTTAYTVTGTNSSGCSSPATFTVVANPLPTMTITASSTSVCLTNAVSYTANGAASYTWGVAGPVSNTYAPIPTANTTYTVFGTSALGCLGSKTIAVTTATLPVVVITPAASTVCLPSSGITFTASGASTYTWNATTTGATITFTPTASTVHTVVGASTQGCTSSKTVALTAFPVPTLAVSPAAATVCAQAANNFSVSGADTYTWNGLQTGSVVSLIHTSNATITVVGTSTNGCSSTSTIGVTTNPLPTVSVSPSLYTMCVSSSFNFTASGAVTYNWFNTSTTAVTAITPTATGAYTVAGTDANGCTSVASVIILTNPLPVLSVSPSSVLVCPSLTVGLSVSGAGTYTWVNATGTGSTAVVNPSVNTTYSVNGTDLATGCVGSATALVSTYSAPVISIAPAGATVCLNSDVIFTASGVSSYTWANSGIGPVTSVTPAANETFTVYGTDANGCNASKTVAVAVNPLPVISVTPGFTTTICKGESASFTASGASTYTWIPGNVNSTTYTTAPTAPSFYTIDATSALGCKNSTLVTVLVDPCSGINETLADQNFANVYPNPSAGIITVEVLGANALLIVYDLLGNVIYSGNLITGKQLVNLSEKAKGVYLVTITTGKKRQVTRLVIE